jgi:rhodanese-related sulfurtransferase
MKPNETPELSIAQAAALLEQDAFLLDVREPDEHAGSRIPGATLIPLAEVSGRTDELPAGREIIVYCRSGGRSARATDFLREQGFSASNLAGGILAWEKEGRPLER